MPRDTPDWASDTPLEDSYNLTMFDGGGGALQEIDVTREEFISLKAKLAEMRGYKLTEGEED